MCVFHPKYIFVTYFIYIHTSYGTHTKLTMHNPINRAKKNFLLVCMFNDRLKTLVKTRYSHLLVEKAGLLDYQNSMVIPALLSNARVSLILIKTAIKKQLFLICIVALSQKIDCKQECRALAYADNLFFIVTGIFGRIRRRASERRRS